MKTAALCLHGRLSTWRRPRVSRPGEHPDAIVNESRALARFAASSLRRHLLRPNLAASVRMETFIHSWNPELGALLDSLYEPSASAHEPVHPELIPMRSQHLSLRRVLALVPSHVEMVVVSRLDLLLFTDLLLRPLHRGPRLPVLWLPHSCQDAHPPWSDEQAAAEAECGCRRHTTDAAGGGAGGGAGSRAGGGTCVGINGRGTVVEGHTLARYGARAKVRRIVSSLA